MSGKERYFSLYSVLEISFTVVGPSTPVEELIHLFPATVEMARFSTSRDLVYIWETDYPGEYVTARDFQAVRIYFRTGFASNRCQVRYTCSFQVRYTCNLSS